MLTALQKKLDACGARRFRPMAICLLTLCPSISAGEYHMSGLVGASGRLVHEHDVAEAFVEDDMLRRR